MKCYVCKSERHNVIDIQKDLRKEHSTDYEIRKCIDCELMYTYPPLTRSLLKSAYELPGYSAHEQAKLTFILTKKRNLLNKFLKFYSNTLLNSLVHKTSAKKLFHSLINFMIRQTLNLAALHHLYYQAVPAPRDLDSKKLLYIGSGSQAKFFFYSAVLGYEVTVLDIIDDQRDAYKSLGITFVHGTLDDNCLHEKFDMVVFSHVIEHFLNPLENMKKLSRLLNSGGMMQIAFPVYGNTEWGETSSSYYDVPRHTIHLTEHTFQSLIGRVDLYVRKKIYLPYGHGYAQNRAKKLFCKEGQFKEDIFFGVTRLDHIKSTIMSFIQRSGNAIFIVQKKTDV